MAPRMGISRRMGLGRRRCRLRCRRGDRRRPRFTYYGYDPYYYPGPYAAPPGPVIYGAPGPAYAVPAAPIAEDAVAYCMQRFKSYDPRSGTYLGYDGARHPCP